MPSPAEPGDPSPDPPGPSSTDPAGSNRAVLARVRELCLGLPEATEKLSHGEPTWFVRKVFVSFSDRHHDDRVAIWCAAPPGAQQARVSADPEHYFVPPYVGGRGWLGVYLDGPVDWDEVADIVIAAYRETAPRRLVAQVDPA